MKSPNKSQNIQNISHVVLFSRVYPACGSNRDGQGSNVQLHGGPSWRRRALVPGGRQADGGRCRDWEKGECGQGMLPDHHQLSEAEKGSYGALHLLPVEQPIPKLHRKPYIPTYSIIRTIHVWIRDAPRSLEYWELFNYIRATDVLVDTHTHIPCFSPKCQEQNWNGHGDTDRVCSANVKTPLDIFLGDKGMLFNDELWKR